MYHGLHGRGLRNTFGSPAELPAGRVILCQQTPASRDTEAGTFMARPAPERMTGHPFPGRAASLIQKNATGQILAGAVIVTVIKPSRGAERNGTVSPAEGRLKLCRSGVLCGYRPRTAELHDTGPQPSAGCVTFRAAAGLACVSRGKPGGSNFGVGAVRNTELGQLFGAWFESTSIAKQCDAVTVAPQATTLFRRHGVNAHPGLAWEGEGGVPSAASHYTPKPGRGSNGECRRERDVLSVHLECHIQHKKDRFPAPFRAIVKTGYEPAEDNRQVPRPIIL